MMDMPRLLIASSSNEFCQSISQCLCGRMQTQCCHSGRQALSLLRSAQPDLLLLDLMLPEMDGLTVLQTAAAEGIHPQVIVTLDFQSPYVLEALTRLQVSYVMLKPCDCSAVLANLEDMAGTMQSAAEPTIAEPPDRQAMALRVLLELGMIPKWNGFACLQLGLPAFAEDPKQTVTKELYHRIGKQIGKNSTLVERNIRTAIQKSWAQGTMAAWRKYFPCAPDGTVPRPSNKAFISHMAQILYPNSNFKVG